MEGQPDTTDLKSLAQTLYANAHARTPREKAEAIWRYLLTDGRFVKPGVFYHIPGWSYEEPMGEVLDPIKLLNSYGFGLCYQDGPLLQALWDAGGFPHTRVWFLTGHTVAEVYYDGGYHYYDSDMMGYTTVGNRSFKAAPVASVYQLEHDPSIILGKMEKPKIVRAGTVDDPWYNADVRAGAMQDLADLFSTTNDNYLYAYRRYPQGHTMDFVLRPGEQIVRYYANPDRSLRYMPYVKENASQREFPKDIGTILTVNNGPRSEKDTRYWSTGRIEYSPTASAIEKSMLSATVAEFRMNSPYVILGASFQGRSPNAGSIKVETSIDDGKTWLTGSTSEFEASGQWRATPMSEAKTEHGSKNAIAGTYGYIVRVVSEKPLALEDLSLVTLFEFNPRTLPELKPGINHLSYSSSQKIRRELPIHASNAKLFASSFEGVEYIEKDGQGFWRNAKSHDGEMVFPVVVPAKALTSFSAGGRFVDLRDGLAPNKLTAETRTVERWPTNATDEGSASIAWSTSEHGPWKMIWQYDSKIEWPDGRQIEKTLRWPEVDKTINSLPPGTQKVFVRYRFRNLALDDIRLASTETVHTGSDVMITHRWSTSDKQMEITKKFVGNEPQNYSVSIPEGTEIKNEAMIMSVGR